MKIRIADNFFKRLKGLMFKKTMGPDEALLFTNTNRIHTSFMHFSIAVHYLDKDYNPIDHEVIGPWKLGKKVKNAKHLIETAECIGYKDPELMKELDRVRALKKA